MAEIVKEHELESMAEILDKTRPVYSGHPAEGEKPSEEAKPSEEEEEKATPSEEEKEEEEKPSPSEEEEEEPPKFKYKSHEEAEKGYKEAEKLVTKRSEETQKERERSEDLQRQLNEANEALLKRESEKPEEKKEPSFLDSSTDRMQKLLQSISNIDPEDKDYDRKVATLWGELNTEQQAEIDRRLTSALEEYDSKKKREQEEDDDEKSTQNRIVEDAAKIAASEGLDMKEDSDDSYMFWSFAPGAPEGTIESQAKWACEKVKKVKQSIVKPYLKSKGKARKAQEENEVLERGGEKPPAKKKEPDKPVTLSEAFEQSERRI